ncbi:MAG: hypothetical protein IPF92_05225 [Myxococcales bacterium]|nr:hypothetical protein [Myxococcales bacterium]MBL0197970.1 hypothetical protein [Myxococcales bacterium]
MDPSVTTGDSGLDAPPDAPPVADVGGDVDASVDASVDADADAPAVRSPGLSFVSVPGTGVGVGKGITVTLTTRNEIGDPVPRVGSQVVFTVSGGTSVVSVGATTDVGDGTYTAVLTGVTPGTKAQVTALLDGAALRTTPASLRVVNPVSLGLTFSLDASNVDRGGNPGTKLCPATGPTQWEDLGSGSTISGALLGFADPCGVGSGWEGTGTAADPHRLAFDGLDDRVSFGAVNDLQKYTIMTWARKTGDGTPGNTGASGLLNVFPVVAKGAPEAESGALDINYYLAVSDTNRIAVDYEHVGTSMNAPLVGGSVLRESEWYMLATTLDSAAGARAVYVNGAVDGSAPPVAGPASGLSSVLVVGGANRSDGTAEGRFRGDVAVVLTYDRALSAAEIEANCHAFSSRFGMRSCKN